MAWMLEGSFKVGTHKIFGDNASKSPNGTMSDAGEGMGELLIKDRLRGASWTTSTFCSFENISTGPTVRASVAQNERVNINLFCTALGKYSKEQHHALLHGVDGYRGNAGYTAWVELDVELLADALGFAASEHYRMGVDVAYAPVAYGEREAVVAGELIRTAMSRLAESERRTRWVFTKPVAFRPEREFRFAIAGEAPNFQAEEFYTSKMHADVRHAFVRSIRAHGTGLGA